MATVESLEEFKKRVEALLVPGSFNPQVELNVHYASLIAELFQLYIRLHERLKKLEEAR